MARRGRRLGRGPPAPRWTAAVALAAAGALLAPAVHPAPGRRITPIKTAVAQTSALDMARESRRLAAAGEVEAALSKAEEALPLVEVEFGSGHPYVGFVLDDLATLNYRLGRLERALAFAERAGPLIAAAYGEVSAEYATLANNRATILTALGRFGEAEPLYRRAHETFERELGPAHGRTAQAARNLGITYGEMARPAEARAYFERAIEANRSLHGEDSPEVARAYLDRAGADLRLEEVGRAREAAEAARRILLARDPVDPADLAAAEVMLARIEIQRSELGPAEARLQEALARLEAAGLGEGEVAASVLYNLGFIQVLRGQSVEAEALYKRLLALYRRLVGEGHPAVARTLHGLAIVYQNLGQYDEAERLYGRAVEVFTDAFGPADASVAATRLERGLLLTEMGRAEEAIGEARAALAIYDRLEGPWTIKRAYATSSLGFALHRAGRLDEAADAFGRALAMMAEVRGPESSDLPPGYTELGEIHLKRGRLADAEAALGRAIAIREKDRAATPQGLAKSLLVLARLRAAQGRLDEALEVARRATAVLRDRLDVAQGALSAAGQGETVNARQLFEGHLAIAHARRERAAGDGDSLLGEMFEVAQFPHLSATAGTLVQTVARLRPDQGELAELLRRRQDAIEAWRALDRLLLDRLAAGAVDGEGTGEARVRLTELAETIRDLDERVRAAFPDYARLINPRPAAADEVRVALGPDEALLLQVTGDEATFLFLLRPGGLRYARTALTAAALEEAVRSLRAGLTLLPGQPFAYLPDFDVRAAHRLYRELLAPFEADLESVGHLIVVPDRAMRGLPFAVLLRTEPAAAPSKFDFDRLRALDFVGKRFALSTVPSADSLVGLRGRAGRSRASRPFLGFGDPVLGPDLPADFGGGAGGRGAAAGADDGASPRGTAATRAPTPGLFWRNGVELDPRAFARMSPLPETRSELLALAVAFDADDPEAAVRLGADATEAAVRTAADLRDHRVLAFATHGLLAGEFGGLAEPALVLTPPAEPGPAEDGLLTASEVAALDLDAEWVILSACNTAAGDEPGGEGLSGLARAFFHAGSRALLVTHWYVPSDAAVALTVFAARALAEEPGIGRAEALRRAIVGTMDGGHPDGRARAMFAHPLFWAPFVNVGEGGAGR